MESEETRTQLPQQDPPQTDRKPWQKPEVEVLAIEQTENGGSYVQNDGSGYFTS